MVPVGNASRCVTDNPKQLKILLSFKYFGWSLMSAAAVLPTPGVPGLHSCRTVTLAHISLLCVTCVTSKRASVLHGTNFALVKMNDRSIHSDSTSSITGPAVSLDRQGHGKLSPTHSCSLFLVAVCMCCVRVVLASTFCPHCPRQYLGSPR